MWSRVKVQRLSQHPSHYDQIGENVPQVVPICYHK